MHVLRVNISMQPPSQQHARLSKCSVSVFTAGRWGRKQQRHGASNFSSDVIPVIKTGESGLTVFRLLTKENRWKWVQANARLVYKNGKPDYIIATQRPLV